MIKKKAFVEYRKVMLSTLIFGILLLLLFFNTGLKSKLSGNSGVYTVEEVIDGDTVILAGVDTHVRYLGIDCPEIPVEDSPGDLFSMEAKSLNERLVGGKKVRLEFDEEKYDDYGRMLAYVFVDGIFVNEYLARKGLASAFIVEPNGKYADVIYQAEGKAKKERVGIWGNLSDVARRLENQNSVIEPAQASRYIGQRVIVSGKITDFRKSDKVLSLRMSNNLNVVIFSGDWENFKFFGINPENYYLGKQVQVIGRVKVYKGKTQIAINHPISIRVVR